MADALKLLVYTMCLCSCMEAMLSLSEVKRVFANDRFYGWLGFFSRSAEAMLGLLVEGLEMTVLCGSTSSAECFTVKGRRILEFIVLASLAIFFTGEYDLPVISNFLKTTSLASLVTMLAFHESAPHLVELASTLYFPLTTGAMIAVSSIADNGHLFWAIFNTILFDRFSEAGKTIETSISYNVAVTLNLFVNALREMLSSSRDRPPPLTDAFVDISIEPPA